MPQMLLVKKYHVEFIPFLSSFFKKFIKIEKNPLQLDLLIFQAILKEIFTEQKLFSCPNAVFFFLSSQECCYVCGFKYITLLSSENVPFFSW